MFNAKLLYSIPAQNNLAESILWNETKKQIWWTDIHESKLYYFDLQTEALSFYTLPERLTSFGFHEHDDWLIAGFESGIGFFNIVTEEIRWLHKIDQQQANTRLNDGRVDAKGRFWVGSMVENFKQEKDLGVLYCVELDGSLHQKLFEIRVSNSICWSNNNEKMYFADSPKKMIKAYHFNIETAELTNEEEFIYSMPGNPDGSIVDKKGDLWNAQWGGAKVVRYDKLSHEITATIDLPCTQPTCLTFAGEQLNLLAISTAQENLSPEALAEQPEAGNIFIYETNITGNLSYKSKVDIKSK